MIVSVGTHPVLPSVALVLLFLHTAPLGSTGGEPVRGLAEAARALSFL